MNSLYDIFLDFENHPSEDIVEVLQTADDQYHNDDESFLTDEEYDALRRYLELSDPTNPYLIGVGSDVRGGKVKLPFEMGSLNQIQIGEIEEWVTKNRLSEVQCVVSDKMDGISCLLVYDNDGKFQIAYSRGNGTEGADISRHISKIANVPQQVNGRMVVRAEIEVDETNFQKVREKVTRHSSKDQYKNARNMVAGLMNRKENPEFVYDYMSVVAYEVLGENSLSKSAQLEKLKRNNFNVVPYTILLGNELTDEILANHIDFRREQSDFAIDGIVIEVDSVGVRNRMNPTRETLNPEYAIKYKVADASNIARVECEGVTWNISKHGYWKPQVNIEPTELVGVTVRNATGFNAKFILDNNIGPGAIIEITRSGDVIPFIQNVIQGTTAQMPDGDWHWNETGVDAIMDNFHEHDEVMAQQLIDFFASIEAPHLKEGSVRKALEYKGCNTNGFTNALLSILNFTENDWKLVIGKKGQIIYDGLQDKLSNIPLHILMGSLPYFGRGIGRRKFKKLEKAYGTEELHLHIINDVEYITAVEGFEMKSAEKIVEGAPRYYNFYNQLPDYVQVQVTNLNQKSGGNMEGQKVVFTGFRDKELQSLVEEAGGEIQNAFSGKTTLVVAKDPNSNSGKLKKARDKGVSVIGIDELKGML